MKPQQLIIRAGYWRRGTSVILISFGLAFLTGPEEWLIGQL